MKNSRDLNDLHPTVRALARAHLAACEAAGIDLIITSTLRDNESQTALYNQGRYGNPGRIVTNARAGQSWHNWGLAYDVVPLRAGKPVWGTTGEDLELWERVGELGKACGLEWAGDWANFKEYPHFQYTAGLTLADMNAGRRLPVAT
jgi:peptidoglycan L-alanyl-D-glutamate endopeptidase CwlK